MPIIKIATYNVNGIRAAMNKGFAQWLETENIDVVCLQEIKANKEQIEEEEKILNSLGYQCFWFSAQKKGYSGTAILTRLAPDAIVYGCEHPLYDAEGRIIRMDYGPLSIVSAYFPSGSSAPERQEIKMEFLSRMLPYFEALKQQKTHLIIAGDYNIAHNAIDIHDPVSNKNSTGFLPEERAWMDSFFASGFIDAFRYLNPQPHQYSWWSYRAASRERNKGWRIDYISVDQNLKDKIENAQILPQAAHSDHCPVTITVNL